jgi:predicted CopG family antitoxin
MITKVITSVSISKKARKYLELLAEKEENKTLSSAIERLINKEAKRANLDKELVS